MKYRNRYLYAMMLGALALIMLVSSSEAAPNSKVGFRLGVYNDAEALSLGVEAITPITSAPIYFNPNVEFIFIENSTFATLNFDFHYDFFTQNRNLFPWAGAGVVLLYRNPEGPIGGNADLGFNLFFGTGFRLNSTVPYIQSKIIISDNTELAISLGIRF